MGNIYTGDNNNLARKMSNLYVGDANGIARKAQNIYIGDANGIARKVYSAFDPVNPSFSRILRENLGVGYHNIGTFLTRDRLLEAKSNGYITLNLHLQMYVNGMNFYVGIASAPDSSFWGGISYRPSNGWTERNFTVSIDSMLASNSSFYYTVKQDYNVAYDLNYYADSYFS